MSEYTTIDYLSWFVVVGFFGIIVLLTLKSLPDGANEAVLILVGQASAGFGAVISYRYGTTQNSGRTDATIVSLAKALPSDTPSN